MNMPYPVRDCVCRAAERRKTLLVLAVVFLAMAVLGICFYQTPAFYDYHLTLCERFVDRVCYSQQSVFLIFLERFAGNALFVLVILAGGVHPVALVLPPLTLCYRAYTFGGSLAVFFSVYRLSGALIVFVLYLPVHLLVDVVLLGGAALSFSRAPRFKFSKGDLRELLCDFLILLVLIAAICLLEMILLLVLFHPLGYLL